MKKFIFGCLFLVGALSLTAFTAQDGEKKEDGKAKVECCCEECDCEKVHLQHGLFRLPRLQGERGMPGMPRLRPRRALLRLRAPRSETPQKRRMLRPERVLTGLCRNTKKECPAKIFAGCLFSGESFLPDFPMPDFLQRLVDGRYVVTAAVGNVMTETLRA